MLLYLTQVVTLATLLLASTNQVDGAPVRARQTSQSPSFASISKPVYAPYYVYFGNPSTKKLADAFSSLGMTAATVGFASAPKGQCALTTDLDGLQPDVAAFIGKGGAVSLAFGGNLQDQTDPRQHIQQACTDPNSLSALIQSAMSKFQTHNIEFDIEDNSLLSDTASASRLGDALALVKKAIPDTYITYTMGTSANGMPPQQLAYLQAAKNSGVTVDAMTLMTMNMGGTDNVADAQTAITGGTQQVATVYGLSTGDATKKMGMLPAIGIDNDGVVIDLAGATTLGKFAQSNQLAVLSYWNFNRDFAGGSGPTQSLTASSSPDQTQDSQFFTTFKSAVGSGSTASSAIANVAAMAGSVDTSKAIEPAQKPPLPPPSAQGAPSGK
jgi:hypothetical protein